MQKYYLDAESTGLDIEQRLTSFSDEVDELIADYLLWVREHEVDYDHTSFSDIRLTKNDRLVGYLEQTDDLSAVIMHPIKYGIIDRIRALFLGYRGLYIL